MSAALINTFFLLGLKTIMLSSLKLILQRTTLFVCIGLFLGRRAACKSKTFSSCYENFQDGTFDACNACACMQFLSGISHCERPISMFDVMWGSLGQEADCQGVALHPSYPHGRRWSMGAIRVGPRAPCMQLGAAQWLQCSTGSGPHLTDVSHHPLQALSAERGKGAALYSVSDFFQLM